MLHIRAQHLYQASEAVQNGSRPFCDPSERSDDDPEGAEGRMPGVK